MIQPRVGENGGPVIRKLTLDLNIEHGQNESGDAVVKITHPEFRGALHLSSSSRNLLINSLLSLDKNQPKSDSPVQSLIDSTNELITQVNAFKEAIVK